MAHTAFELIGAPLTLASRADGVRNDAVGCSGPGASSGSSASEHSTSAVSRTGSSWAIQQSSCETIAPCTLASGQTTKIVRVRTRAWPEEQTIVSMTGSFRAIRLSYPGGSPSTAVDRFNIGQLLSDIEPMTAHRATGGTTLLRRETSHGQGRRTVASREAPLHRFAQFLEVASASLTHDVELELSLLLLVHALHGFTNRMPREAVVDSATCERLMVCNGLGDTPRSQRPGSAREPRLPMLHADDTSVMPSPLLSVRWVGWGRCSRCRLCCAMAQSRSGSHHSP